MKENTFSWNTLDDTLIHAVVWKPKNPAFVICLVHGLGEHIGRYSHFAQYFSDHGGVTIGFDQRGHGRSGGKRGHIPSYQSAMDDVSKLLVQAETSFPNLPVFLYGHSMGGALVMNYFLERHPRISGLIATGPWIELAFKASPIKVAMAKTVDFILPGLIQPNGLDPNLVSSDEKVVTNYIQDPLVHDRISVRAANSYMTAGNLLNEYSGTLSKPLLLMHGEADQITSFNASKRFASRVSGDITFRSWPGMQHEIHNEPEHKQVFEYSLNWVRQKA